MGCKHPSVEETTRGREGRHEARSGNFKLQHDYSDIGDDNLLLGSEVCSANDDETLTAKLKDR